MMALGDKAESCLLLECIQMVYPTLQGLIGGYSLTVMGQREIRIWNYAYLVGAMALGNLGPAGMHGVLSANSGERQDLEES